MIEDRNSIYLRKLNSEIISLNKQIEKKKFKYRIKTIRRLFSYIMTGNFRHIKNQIKNRIENQQIKVTNYENDSYDIDNKIVIFTVLFGDYDNLKDPIYISDKCDYYVLTNQEITSKVWKKKNISKFKQITEKMSNLEMARFYKTHPHLLFDEYDYSIFVDANIQIVADLIPMISTMGSNFISIHKQPGRDCIYDESAAIVSLKKANKKEVKYQMNSYKKSGFPKHFGLFQTNIIVRNHNNTKCIKLMEYWWDEMTKFTKRDQLSFTYSLWMLGYTKDAVSILGDNTALNPRVRVVNHK